MDYLEYIYSGSFGTFTTEEANSINYFFEQKDKGETPFFDSEVLETVISYQIEHSDYDGAKETLGLANKYYPKNEEFDFLEVCLERKYNPQKSLGLVNKFLKKYSDVDAILLKSTIYFLLKNFEKAEQTFKKYLEKIADEQEKAENILNMALFLAHEDFENDDDFMMVAIQIKKFIERAIVMNLPQDVLLTYADNFYMFDYLKEAKIIIDYIIDLDAYNLDAWRLLSDILFDNEQFLDAAEALKYRIALNDSDKNLYYESGICYFKIEMYEAALLQFTMQLEMEVQEIEDKKFYCEISNYIGECYIRLNKINQAFKEFEQVLKIDSRNFKAIVCTAQCFYIINDNQQAIQFLEKALALEHDYSNNQYEKLYNTIAQVFIDIAENKPFKEGEDNLLNAILAYRKSLIYINLTSKAERRNYDLHNGMNAFTLMQIGKLYYILQDYTNALVHFQLAYNFDEETPQVACFLAMAYYKMDFKQEAINQLNFVTEREMDFFKANFPDFNQLLIDYKITTK
jgi:tetratricopeptide (TPR) repeat protein